MTGQQKLWSIQFMEEYLQVPGNARKSGFQNISIQLKCSVKQLKRVWQHKDYWKDWAEKQERKASLREGTRKLRGQRVTNLQTGGKGCRKPGDRGYLGRTDHCRQFVLQVAVWAELEESQGHQLFRPDLVRHPSQLLDSAILFADEDVADSTSNPDKKKSLQLGKRSSSVS